jgi:uncharacterized protein (DUF302 family)
MDQRMWKPAAVLAGALLMAVDAGGSDEGSPVATGGTRKPLASVTSTVAVLHKSVTVDREFESFTNTLERILGHLPAGVQQDMIERPEAARQRIKAAEGAQGLMIFSILDHGAALNMIGARRNAKQYLIGNPSTAIQMTQHDIRAALYAPLRVLVYEHAAGQTTIEYDQPSSLFGQFGRDAVTGVAVSLDRALEEVIAQAAEQLPH